MTRNKEKTCNVFLSIQCTFWSNLTALQGSQPIDTLTFGIGVKRKTFTRYVLQVLAHSTLFVVIYHVWRFGLSRLELCRKWPHDGPNTSPIGQDRKTLTYTALTSTFFKDLPAFLYDSGWGSLNGKIVLRSFCLFCRADITSLNLISKEFYVA